MIKKGLSLGKAVIFLGLILGPAGFLPESKAAVVPIDSVGVQVVKGKQYLIHQVQAKETFFSIARKYRLPADKIIKANAQIKASLKSGDLVYIPRATASRKLPVISYRTDAQGNKVHRVSSKQTLFSISQQYQLAPADIKRWNNLKSEQLRVGQDLIIGPAAKPAASAANSISAIASPAAVSVSPATPAPRQAPIIYATKKERMADKPDSAAMKVVSRIRESGIAEVINGVQSNKYLALHHSAPVGSYVTVINRMNGRSISVRVIGILPDIGSNEKVIIKLSKKAQQKLIALDQRFLVDVIYTPQ